MNKNGRAGMSLLESLVVIAGIGIMIGLLLPPALGVRDSAMRLQCANNFKHIGLAFHAYHDTHGRLPLNIHPSKEGVSWMVLILPHLGEEALNKRAEEATKLDSNSLHNPPHSGLATVVKTYVCPADGRSFSVQTSPLGFQVGMTSYIGNGGGGHPDQLLGFWGAFPDGPSLSDFKDGTGNTFLVGERPTPSNHMAGWWYPSIWVGRDHGPHNFLLLGAATFIPTDGCSIKAQEKVFGPGDVYNICDRFHFWSLHRGGAQFLFGDGSVRMFNYSAGDNLILSLASRKGGEIEESEY